MTKTKNGEKRVCVKGKLYNIIIRQKMLSDGCSIISINVYVTITESEKGGGNPKKNACTHDMVFGMNKTVAISTDAGIDQI